MAPDFDQPAKLARDRRLRRRLLATLLIARAESPKGGVAGRSLYDLTMSVVPRCDRFEGDSHATGLLRSLVDKGMIAEEQLPRKRWENFGLEYLFYRITDHGESLLRQTVPPDADIDDDRILGYEDE